MSWMWLNLPLGALIFLAVAGIPLWLVLKRPDHRPSFEPIPVIAVAVPSRASAVAVPSRASAVAVSSRADLAAARS